MKYNVTNNTKNPRIIFAGKRGHEIGMGATVPVEMTEDEMLAEVIDGLEFEAVPNEVEPPITTPEPAPPAEPEPDAPPIEPKKRGRPAKAG